MLAFTAAKTTDPQRRDTGSPAKRHREETGSEGIKPAEPSEDQASGCLETCPCCPCIADLAIRSPPQPQHGQCAPFAQSSRCGVLSLTRMLAAVIVVSLLATLVLTEPASGDCDD
jgi:hypothetical protein